MYAFFNKLIDRLLKLPKAVVLIVLALSFIYADIFQSMSAASNYLVPLFGRNVNNYLSVFLLGPIFWLLFELVALIYFFIVRSVLGAAEIQKNKPAMMNILRWFYIVLNIVIGSVRMLYFKYPLAVMFTENIFIFALTLATLILYYFFIRKKFIAPQLYPRSVMAFCMPYLVFQVATLVMNFTGGLF